MVSQLLLEALVRGLQVVDPIVQPAELLPVAGDGLVPPSHPLLPLLLEPGVVTFELGPELGELLLELLCGAGSVDRCLALR